MENKKIILSDEIAKLVIARRVTISDLDNAKNPVCILALNAKKYQILSCLLISCIKCFIRINTKPTINHALLTNKFASF